MNYIELKQTCQELTKQAQTTATNLTDLILTYSSEIQERLKEEYFANGPLDPLLQNPDISEIILQGPEQIWFEYQGELKLYHDSFLSELTFENFVHRLSEEAHILVNLNTPCGDGFWQHHRVHIIKPPLSKQPQISLRKHPRESWTLAKLAELNWAPPTTIKAIRQWLKEEKNFLIIGPTGSGKTSVLNACLQELSPQERVVCMEDTDELAPRAGASCKLHTRFDTHNLLKDFNLADLVKQSLRMRPSRLVVGEVRGPEAKDLLLALATGHRGSLGTLHASDPRQALIRLEMLVQLGAGQWDHQAIRQLIKLSVDGLLVVGKSGSKRKCEGLYQIASLENFGFLVDQVA